MANTLKLKQSAVSAKVPTTAQLQLGELAVNTYDGRLFTKKNVSGTESIIEFVSNDGTWGISITGNAATVGGKAIGTSGNTIPLLNATNTWSGVQTIAASYLGISESGWGSPGARLRISTSAAGAVFNQNDNSGIIFQTQGVTRVTIGDGTGNLVATGTVTGTRLISNIAQGTAPLGVTSTTVCTNLNADLLDGYHVGTSGGVIPLLNAENTWSALQTIMASGNQLLLHSAASAPTVIFRNDGTTFYLLLSDAGASPSGTWNALRPFAFNLTTGAVTIGNGLTATLTGNASTATTLQTARNINGTSFNGSANITTATWGTARTLTIGNTGKSVDGSAAVSWSLAEIGALPLTGGTLTGSLSVSAGGASITGGLSAYSATNDYTQATVKFGRSSASYIALHGHSSGNYLTHVVSDANPGPFRIALKTETLSWEHVFAMDGYIVPSQGIRWGSTGSAPPATSTRSAGTKLVLYPSLGASTVDYGIGIDTNTQWYSIPQQSSRCFKWYAGTTPIAALHGDGNHFVYDPGPTTQNTAVTLTAAQIRKCIIQSTPTAGITLTLPTSSNMNNTLWDGGTGMDWSVINLATDGTKTVTLAGNTNHTIVGNAVVAINSSARFRTIKSIDEQDGLPVFTTYRIS